MAKTIIQWLGHSFFRITSPGGRVILIDPWAEGNPSAAVGVEEIDRADLVLVTHDHFDHLGQAADLIKKTGALAVANVETAQRMQNELGVDPEKVIFGGFGMNIGGSADVNGITVTMTQAFHSSASGAPAGYIIKMEDGTTMYHAGDTGIFSTMSVLGDLYPIDVAMLPIGSVFTMDPVQAACALTLLRPKNVIPMHFGTFPILEQNADTFRSEAARRAPDTKIVELKPGEKAEF
ncbi:MAG: metal-dependent hydrolase [Deltaproteobacteria bacterium]|nr:metal-dependent hydrolase [Deltaproteobacteria bacterium]